MKKRFGMLYLVLVVCQAGMCMVSGTVRFVDTDTLNEVDAVITISQAAGASQATAEATITLGPLSFVRLKSSQSVEVNGEELTSADSTGHYRATVDAAGTYTVTVREPARGVGDTLITAADFEITSPGSGETVSLSGFTVSWSNADGNLQVEVSVTQNLLGRTRALTLDPVQDTGGVDVGGQDLWDAGFGQGADLTITVTRINELDGINGFRSGTLTTRRSESATVQPGS